MGKVYAIDGMIQEGEPFGPVQLHFTSLAGRDRELVVHGAPLTQQDGRRAGGIVLVEDVTERVELERHLEGARRLEAVGRIAAGVTHDFSSDARGCPQNSVSRFGWWTNGAHGMRNKN